MMGKKNAEDCVGQRKRAKSLAGVRRKKEKPQADAEGLWDNYIKASSSGLTTGANLGRAHEAQQSQATPNGGGEGDGRGAGFGDRRPFFEAVVVRVGHAETGIKVDVRVVGNVEVGGG